MPDKCCSPASPPTDRAASVATDLLRPQLLFRLGHPHRRQRSGALQSDVLSQRLDLAARQCADRARACALWPQARHRHAVRRPVRRRDLYGPAPAAGIVLRLPAPARPRPDALSRSPVRRRPGRAPRRSRFWKPRLGLEFDPFKGEIRLRNPRLPAFLDEVVLRDLRLARRASICGYAVTARTCRSIRRASAAISGFRSSFRPDRRFPQAWVARGTSATASA